MDEFMTYLEEKRAELEVKEAALCAEGRRDEADMEKVKFNVYGMCLAIYQTVVRQCKPEELRSVYLKRLEEFPEKWEETLKKAEEYGDERGILVEQSKLQTLQEARSHFLSFGG